MKKISSFILSLLILFSLSVPALGATTSKKLLPVEPRVKAKAAISYDLTNNEIILEKNMNEKMFPASITKLMTALLLAEHSNREDALKIGTEPLKQPSFAINKNMYKLYKGDTITADAAMKAILLPSANDMAVVAAEHVGTTIEGFVQMMNEKAKELGMASTHFVNPSGLHDPEHYTTAYDLAKLAKAAYANDWVREIIATQTANIRTKNQKIGDIKNSNQLLGINGNVGGKTGFTPEAGRCLIGIYVRDGREVIQVLLNDGTTSKSTLVFTDMAAMADEAYAMEKVAMVTKGTPVDSITAEYKLFRWFGPIKKVQIKAQIQDDLMLYNNTINNDSEGLTPSVKPLSNLDVFELNEGLPVADITLVKGETTLTTKALSQTNTFDSIIMPNAVPYAGLAVGGLLAAALILFLIIRGLRSRKSTQHKIRSKRQAKRRKTARTNFTDRI